tara:strand:+ start:5418 stop:5738 length:321 start_codon:yes stop_codon:yes gene_type:complete
LNLNDLIYTTFIYNTHLYYLPEATEERPAGTGAVGATSTDGRLGHLQLLRAATAGGLLRAAAVGTTGGDGRLGHLQPLRAATAGGLATSLAAALTNVDLAALGAVV